MYKREIWFAKVFSKEVKRNKEIFYSIKTSVVGSTLEEALSLPTTLKNRVEGDIYKIEFLKPMGKTTYKL